MRGKVGDDKLHIADYSFESRLILGTGKYKDLTETKLAIETSGAEVVTVALKKVNITSNFEQKLQDFIDPLKYTYLPNTAFCSTADEAVKHLMLAREIGEWDLVKLEIFGDSQLLYPDVIETLKATKILVTEGFKVMTYCNDDPIICKKLQDMGAVAIMPLAAPIGSGLGIQNLFNLQVIVNQSSVPVIVDAGFGVPSDVALAMECGCAGVIVNTGIAKAKNPILMAKAMKLAVEAGRLAFLAGRMPKSNVAHPSSPRFGVMH
jgi:thiazole synthase